MLYRYHLNLFAVAVISFFLPLNASANNSQTSAICERVAQQVSTETGVPLSVLRAITLTETGRNKGGSFQPWPWTVNMEGLGKWFENYEQAKTYVDTHYKRGARSFDVGCFQLNYRWHNQAFSSIEEMFDPLSNARYAAKFLSELYDEFGSWPKAAGAYHSRTPKYAKKYTARFNRIRDNLEAPPAVELAVVKTPQPEKPPARVNRFPLLQSGTPGQMASLVPLGLKGNRLIDVANSSAKPVN